MWIFTVDGFFSVVESEKDPRLFKVRGRYLEDIEKVAKRLGTTVHETPEHDYPCRIFIAKEKWAEYLRDAVLAIDYGNFKNAVAERQGWDREAAYHKVWDVVAKEARDFERRGGAGR